MERVKGLHAEELEKAMTKIRVLEMKLETAERKQAEYQKKIKTSVIRGVCALNMETMGVLNDGVEAPMVNEEKEDQFHARQFSPFTNVDLNVSLPLAPPLDAEEARLHQRTNDCNPTERKVNALFPVTSGSKKKSHIDIKRHVSEYGYAVIRSDQTNPNDVIKNSVIQQSVRKKSRNRDIG